MFLFGEKMRRDDEKERVTGTWSLASESVRWLREVGMKEEEGEKKMWSNMEDLFPLLYEGGSRLCGSREVRALAIPASRIFFQIGSSFLNLLSLGRALFMSPQTRMIASLFCLMRRRMEVRMVNLTSFFFQEKAGEE